MKKGISVVVSTILGVSASSIADEVVSFNEGKVSDSRYILASADEMTCGKEMKQKVQECKKMMKEMKCGSEMMKEMQECQKILEKAGEGKSKDKSKEMACGKCGAMM